jgi:uncharacterized cofD-like protein
MSGPCGAAPRVVALGGGHGLAVSLAALRAVTEALTAVVTVADDGGSSGRLRAELAALPPGDLRMALAALAGRDQQSELWARLLQHRFPGAGSLGGHAVGNLVLAGLCDLLGNPVDALDATARLLGAAGRVLPASCEAVDIVADVSGLDPADPARRKQVRGQHEVASTEGRVHSVRLLPDPPVACPEAVEAVRAADWVVLGPGSLFTSVLPHLLVPELAEAVLASNVRRLLVLNLAPQVGETTGFSPEAHLDALVRHVSGLRLDIVLADPAAVGDVAELAAAAAGLGAQLRLEPIAVSGHPRHDANRLAQAFAGLMGSGGS